jgi:predicted nuclease of predicted toxin-antitoxin system
MRVLLDACIDPRVSELFEGHDVTTAFQVEWHHLKDRVWREYALAEDRGEVARNRNDYHLSSLEYANALYADGDRKGRF